MIPAPKIDVHGMNSEQACNLIRANLVSFYNRGYPELYIIHGHGQGILRQNIRAMLNYFPFIKKLRKGKHEEGGDGITVVIFK